MGLTDPRLGARHLRERLRKNWDRQEIPAISGLTRDKLRPPTDEYQDALFALYGRRWDEVTEEVLMEDQTALTFINEELKPYYVASYMDVILAAVEQGRDLGEIYAVIERAGASLENQRWTALRGVMSPEQVRIIGDFLRLAAPLDISLKEAYDLWCPIQSESEG